MRMGFQADARACLKWIHLNQALRVSCFLLALLGCSRESYDNTLPDSSQLGSPRGLRIARVISHFHSPYSWDACDKKGLNGGVPDASCLQHLRDALCSNRVDVMFLTDHPDAMVNYEMRDLLLVQTGDQLVLKNGNPYVNQMGGCSSSFRPQILVGFEDQLLSLGMTQHLDPSPSVRSDLYHQETVAVRNRLGTETEALVVIPHTESRTIALIQELQPDGIEIYNFHANLDPKIRMNFLSAPPFKPIPWFLSYIADPYKELNPDFAFIHFVEMFPVYFQTWNTLIQSGLRVAGFGGSDSHENVFPQTVADGERMDGHRRMMRAMSNHILVSQIDPDLVKKAMKAGQSWLVFEGLGSPVGMDLYATIGSTVVGVGQTGSLSGGSAVIHVEVPHLYSGSPQKGDAPQIRAVLKQVIPGGKDQVVARSSAGSAGGGEILYSTSTAGAYRAEVMIVPKHLKELMGPYGDEATQELTWVITNHLYLDP